MKNPIFLALIVLAVGTVGSSQEDPITDFENKVEEQIEKRIVKEAKEAAVNRPLPSGLIIIAEFIEVDHVDFSDWLLENPITTDATPLRKEVQGWVKAGRGKVVATAAIHARSGQRAKTEAIHEWVYPTEYDPPQISAEGGDAAEGKNVTPASPTAFETRNVGVTLEVDPVIGADMQVIDLNLAPEIVMADENSTHGSSLGGVESTVEMPRFMTSKITTQVSVRPGDYSFLGTSRLGKTQLPDSEDPILLLFVRCDLSGSN
ncbi:MAG: hypothetical protein AAGA96_06625 [Verrucomicrobiota bacterium]